jgi:glycosyltransferase involved in cell wall biosynthesis
MNEPRPAQSPSPLAFFDFAYHYGGSFTGTVALVGEMRHLTDVALIDAYGTCESYVADLKALGVAPVVLFPGRSGDNTIGGRGATQRLAKMALSVPHMAALASRLYRTIREIQPRALWVNSEKALFVAWLAAPRRLPIAVMIRTEMRRIRPYCTLAWRRANAVLAVSENTLNQLRSTGYAPSAQHVVHDGIDVDGTLERAKSEPANLPRSTPDALVLAFPATLAGPLKGHEAGIRAVAELIHSRVDVDLWLCGDVPSGVSPEFYHRMRRLARELGVSEHVHFVGYRNDIESVMARSDIVLLPSYTEGLPRSLMEAMALGRPVLATDVGGIPELVRDGIDGILIEAGDVDALVDALHVLRDPSVRQRMGQAGQRRVREHFSLRRQAVEFVRIMDALAPKAAQGDLSHRRLTRPAS